MNCPHIIDLILIVDSSTIGYKRLNCRFYRIRVVFWFLWFCLLLFLFLFFIFCFLLLIYKTVTLFLINFLYLKDFTENRRKKNCFQCYSKQICKNRKQNVSPRSIFSSSFRYEYILSSYPLSQAYLLLHILFVSNEWKIYFHLNRMTFFSSFFLVIRQDYNFVPYKVNNTNKIIIIIIETYVCVLLGLLHNDPYV